MFSLIHTTAAWGLNWWAGLTLAVAIPCITQPWKQEDSTDANGLLTLKGCETHESYRPEGEKQRSSTGTSTYYCFVGTWLQFSSTPNLLPHMLHFALKYEARKEYLFFLPLASIWTCSINYAWMFSSFPLSLTYPQSRTVTYLVVGSETDHMCLILFFSLGSWTPTKHPTPFPGRWDAVPSKTVSQTVNEPLSYETQGTVSRTLSVRKLLLGPHQPVFCVPLLILDLEGEETLFMNSLKPHSVSM